LAKSGRHTSILEFKALAAQAMWDRAEAVPGSRIDRLARQLTDDPGSRLALPDAGGTPVPARPAAAVVRLTDTAQVDTGTTELVPFPGLEPFGEAEAEWFFGRDRVIAELVDRMATQLAGLGPLILVARSGTGKTSLLRAGLLPALDRGVLPPGGSSDWPRLIFKPTAAPVRQLAARTAALGGIDAHALHDRLLTDPASFCDVLRSALTESKGSGPGESRRVVIVVDQFEEVFSLCTDSSQRLVFIRALTAAASSPSGDAPALVVLGLRTDFYDHCTAFPELAEALRHSQILLGAMNAAEIRSAIEQPARRAELEWEPGLVELLLRDLANVGGPTDEAYAPGGLPLLAHALFATWQQRAGRTLTVEGYQNTSGIQGAVASTAERVFAAFDDVKKETARGLLLRLVQIGDGTDDTRRRMDRSRLLAGSGSPETAAVVLEEFRAARLVTAGESTIEIVHDALLRAWPRLRKWIDDDREGHLTWQHLEQTAVKWDGHDSAELLRGDRLETARVWAAEHDQESSFQARAFLGASVAQERRVRRARHRVIAVLVVLALLATASAAVAYLQQRTTAAERDKAVLRQVSLEIGRLRAVDPDLAARLSVAAYRRTPTGTAVDPDVYLGLVGGAAVRTDTTAQGAVVALGHGGRLVAFGHKNGSIDLFGDLSGSRPVLLTESALEDNASWQDGEVVSLAFSPDDRILVAGRFKGVFSVWNVEDPAKPRLLVTVHRKALTLQTVAIDRTGRILAVAGWNDDQGGGEDKVELDDFGDPARPTARGLLPLSEGIDVVAFSPAGAVIAGGGPMRPAVLWDVADPARPMLLPPPAATSFGTGSVAFSANGGLLAETDQTSARLWDLSHPEGRRRLGDVSGHVNPIAAIAISPVNPLMVTGDDGTLRLWDITNPGRPSPVGALPAHVASMAFRDDGRVMATAGPADYGVVLWHLDADEAVKIICAKIGPLSPRDWVAHFPYDAYSSPCA
jgi:hypothetical protein